MGTLLLLAFAVTSDAKRRNQNQSPSLQETTNTNDDNFVKIPLEQAFDYGKQSLQQVSEDKNFNKALEFGKATFKRVEEKLQGGKCRRRGQSCIPFVSNRTNIRKCCEGLTCQHGNCCRKIKNGQKIIC